MTLNDLATEFLKNYCDRRLCSFTGVFKKVARQLKLDDLNDGDLVNTDNEKIRTDLSSVIVTYKWTFGFGYRLTNVRFEEKENIP